LSPVASKAARALTLALSQLGGEAVELHLEPAGWPHWRRTAAFALLADALYAEEAWWGHALLVHDAEHPDETAVELSRHYAEGKRRHVIAELLFMAANEPTRKDAHHRMMNFGGGARTVEAEETARPRHYGFDPQGFCDVVGLGAGLTAARGARKCFECREPLPSRTVGDYCRQHDGISRVGAKEAAEGRERAIRRLFEQLRLR